MFSRKIFTRLLFAAALVAASATIACANKSTDSLTALLKSLPDDTTKVRVLSELSFQLVSINGEEARLRAKETIALSEKLKFDFGIAQGYSRLALAYKILTRYDSTFYYYRKSVALFTSIGRMDGVLRAYLDMGNLFNRMGQMDSAAYYLYKSLSLSEFSNDPMDESRALAAIGLVLRDQGKYDEAIDHFLRALRIAEEAGNKKNTAINTENLANAYLTKKDYSTAQKYFDRTLALYVDLDEQRSLARIRINIAHLQREQGNYKEAMASALYAAKLYEEMKNTFGSIHALESMAETNLAMKNYRDAEMYIQRGIALAQQTGNGQLELNGYSLLEKIYLGQGNHKLAHEMLRKSTALNDSMFNVKKETIISELQTKYETGKKESEIKLLSKDKELSDAKIRRQEIVRNSIIAGAGLILIIGFLLFNRYRISQKHKRQQERMRISSDLHDEIGSTLSSIGMYSAFAAQQLEANQTGEAKNILGEISSSSQEMIDDMNDIIWAINPRNDSFKHIIDRLRNYSSRMAQSKNIALDFRNDDSLHTVALSMEQRKNLFLICKEAVNNAVKYSDCKNLAVKFERGNKNFSVEVADDGKGFNAEESFEGNGLKNMRQRAQQIAAGFSIQSSGSGTVVKVEMGGG